MAQSVLTSVSMGYFVHGYKNPQTQAEGCHGDGMNHMMYLITMVADPPLVLLFLLVAMKVAEPGGGHTRW